MRWSKALIPTQKETPADAVAPSHVFLLRAGMVRQLGAGAYTYLPLGFRVLNKVIKIIREEMEAAGASELLMPALQPVELWKQSGRYETFGELLMQLTISSNQTIALGPTHEEVITDLVRDLVKSYRQLPITLYQIQTKFRDEPRPRFGILRTREFLMKDAYSFDADVEQLSASYDAMYEAYCRIFDRCGIPYVIVEAESGPIGGDSSHEFMVPSSTGEDVVVQCPSCDYAANRERAEIGEAAATLSLPDSTTPFEEVVTPGRRTIQEVCTFLKVPESTSAKLLVFLADDKPVAVLIRGDHEANEAKVRRAFGASTLVAADAATVEKVTGAPMGFLGPIAIKIPLAIDRSVAAMPHVVVGANAVDLHLKGVVPGRDFPLDRVVDLRNAAEGDPCPRCGATMIVKQGIEVGHVFKLGTKYSKAMGATFLDDKGAEIPLIMGCYGIGVNRIVAAAVEAGHDDNGIVWPLPIAPYEALIVPLQPQNPAVLEAAESLEKQFTEAGIDVLMDDREQRPGVKFKDADLIGIPLRIVISERGLKEGTIEVKWRTDAAAHQVPAATAGEAILAELEAIRKGLAATCVERRIARAAAKGQ
ncbi:proline--tRNA ligase [Singulisphaera acidiphila]|uniref:Proline--tRNA ligase n=1 Tax=Singulisphaera acidiphila (strain ATCC BAA-1392 / DSM 18658 / VKM B-2454 / MOB10) TaxID=886293 RepID=L0D7Z6_SINAD|nr:proline--tRNA ligase [Singulisphaera acidiphila]AGA25529.1 prolyl-tRNA synthetase, family II [Singulisphaera acidiphila DSM 18658]